MNRQARRRQLADLPKAPDVSARFAADMKVATTLQKTNRLKEAVDVYRKIVKVYEGHPDLRVAWSNMGAALQLQGKLDDAVQALKKARALKPDHPPPHHNLGMALLAQGRAPEAIDSLTRALELDPDFRDAWFGLGTACQALGDTAPGEAVCRRILERHPNCLHAHFNLANLLRVTARHEEALVHYRRCLDLQPGLPEVIFSIGRIQEDGGDLAGAAHSYLEALASAPEADALHNQLGLTLQNLAHTAPDRAKELAATWRTTYPDNEVARRIAPLVLGETMDLPDRNPASVAFNPFG